MKNVLEKKSQPLQTRKGTLKRSFPCTALSISHNRTAMNGGRNQGRTREHLCHGRHILKRTSARQKKVVPPPPIGNIVPHLKTLFFLKNIDTFFNYRVSHETWHLIQLFLVTNLLLDYILL